MEIDEMKIGDLIRRKAEIKERKSVLSAEEKILNEEERKIDGALITQLESIGTNKASSIEGYGSITLSEDIVPEIVDWDEFYAHIAKTGDFSLLQRRPSVTSFREAIAFSPIPGAAARTVKKINYRSS
jgi:hypothetical protein